MKQRYAQGGAIVNQLVEYPRVWGLHGFGWLRAENESLNIV